MKEKHEQEKKVIWNAWVLDYYTFFYNMIEILRNKTCRVSVWMLSIFVIKDSFDQKHLIA